MVRITARKKHIFGPEKVTPVPKRNIFKILKLAAVTEKTLKIILFYPF
jgi:hypothetical protein